MVTHELLARAWSGSGETGHESRAEQTLAQALAPCVVDGIQRFAQLADSYGRRS